MLLKSDSERKTFFDNPDNHSNVLLLKIQPYGTIKPFGKGILIVIYDQEVVMGHSSS